MATYSLGVIQASRPSAARLKAMAEEGTQAQQHEKVVKVIGIPASGDYNDG